VNQVIQLGLAGAIGWAAYKWQRGEPIPIFTNVAKKVAAKTNPRPKRGPGIWSGYCFTDHSGRQWEMPIGMRGWVPSRLRADGAVVTQDGAVHRPKGRGEGTYLCTPVGEARKNPGRNFDYPSPQEGAMAQNYLWQMAGDAKKLHDLLRANDDLPGWVNAYIATSADRLGQASRYMQHKIAMGGKAKGNPRGEQSLGKTLLAVGVVIGGLYLWGRSVEADHEERMREMRR